MCTAFEFSSGAAQVDVVELFTSEGCSSCPPADRWISKLKHDPGLWQRFVPLAFHVDYWDYIGWRDRFASPSYSQRQRNYAARGGVATVYTPGFLVNGREWRGWFRGERRPESADSVGVLSIAQDGESLAIAFAPTDAMDRYNANIAYLGTNLASEIRAGENRGKQLLHDFVVLQYLQVPLDRNGNSHIGQAPLGEYLANTDITAIAAWVNAADGIAPLQATGGWLEPR